MTDTRGLVERRGRVVYRDGCRITYFADGLGFVAKRIAPIRWSAICDPNDWSAALTDKGGE